MCFKVISVILTFSFLISNPSQANLTDALKPPRSDSHTIVQIAANLEEASNSFHVTDPEKIIIAENIGRVKEIFKGQDGKLIINIQDAHCNFEAQTNISQILDVLVKNGLRIVALEGSSGEIDPSLFTTFPDEDIRKEVAAYFMKKGEINGAEYLAITSKNPPQLYGVETKEYYLANLNSFLNSLKGRNEMKSACAGVRSILDKLKERIYSKELKELDAKALLNNGNNEGNLVEYCEFLKQAAESRKAALDKFSNLALLYKTINIEKALDFNKVETERAGVIAALEKTLSQNEIEELFEKSVSFKSGKIGAAMYHVYLRKLASVKGIDLTDYPNLNLYSEYLVIYEEINSYGLLKEITALEDEIKEKLFKNNDQRALEKLSRNIRLLENMLDIAMSREDVDYYQQNKNDFRSEVFIDFIKNQSKKYNTSSNYDPNFALLDKYLPDLENFYRIADTRNDAIIENTLKRMDEKNLNVAALITGGYHTEGIAERLRARGISYIVIAPRITKEDKDNPYLKVLSGGARQFVTDNISAADSNDAAPAVSPQPSSQQGRLATTSLLAKDKMASPAAADDFTIAAAVISLADVVFHSRQDKPDMPAAEVKRRVEQKKAELVARYTDRTRLQKLIQTVDFNVEGIALDPMGQYYVPVMVAGKQWYVRLHRAQAPPEDVNVGAKRKAITESGIGIQLLTAQQFDAIRETLNTQRVSGSAPAGELPAEAVSQFRAAYNAWAGSQEGQGAPITRRVQKIAELFVNGMHGLNGNPHMWLPEFVRAISGDDASVVASVENQYERMMSQLRQVCGPQAVVDATTGSRSLSPLFSEPYSLPSFVSTDLISLLMTAVDIVSSEGRITFDGEGRLYHSAYSLCAVADLTGIEVTGGREQQIALLRTLTDFSTKPIVWVKQDAGDKAPNHFIEIEFVGDHEITYRDNGVQKTELISDFGARWAGVILVDKREYKAKQDKISASARPIAQTRLKNIKGGCGVIRTVGGATGIAAQIWSMTAVEYRGRDDEGVAYYGRHGVDVVKVKGYSENLARAIYMEGLGTPEEEMAFCPDGAFADSPDDQAARIARDKLIANKRLTAQERTALHKKWKWLFTKEGSSIRMVMLKALRNERHALEEELKTLLKLPPTPFSRCSETCTTEALYDITKTESGTGPRVGIGVYAQTEFTARKYDLRPNNIRDVMLEIQRVHRLDMTTIKYFVKFELQNAVRGAAAAGQDIEREVAHFTEMYDRLIERVLRGERFEGETLRDWQRLSSFFTPTARGTCSVIVPPLLTRDPVRHIFHIQDALWGILKANEEWKDKVNREFQLYRREHNMPVNIDGSIEGLEKMWMREMRVGMPGIAFTVLTRFLQKEFVRNPGETSEETMRKFGVSLGKVDAVTVGFLYWLDFITGHDRWSTTGSSEQKNAHPHPDLGFLAGLPPELRRAIIAANIPAQAVLDQPTTTRENLNEYLSKCLNAAKEVKERILTRVIDHNGDLNPKLVATLRERLSALGYEFLTEDGQKIGTDTKVLVVLWEYIRDMYGIDVAMGRIHGYGVYRDPNSGKLFLDGKAVVGGQEISYAQLWNNIAEKLHGYNKAFDADEIALRVALCILGPKSEIALDTASMHMPTKHIVVGHSRPIYVVIREGKTAKYQVTSDYQSALSLWDVSEISAAVAEINRIEDEEGRRPVEELTREYKEKIRQIEADNPPDKITQIAEADAAYRAKVLEIIQHVETKQNAIRAGFTARVVKLGKTEGVASVSWSLSDDGPAGRNWRCNVEYSNFMGDPQRPSKESGIDDTKENREIEKREIEIPIDLADKRTFRTFAECHIDQIRWITLRSIMSYIMPDNTVDLGMRRTTTGEIDRPGLDIEKLRAHFGQNLEKLRRIIITGIGSSERDAKCALNLFRTVLPGVEVIAIDPSVSVTEDRPLDPDSDLVIGLSWSGTTALTYEALLLANHVKGAPVASLTGNLAKEIGALTKDSAGTVKVYTGQEVAVFTTKGFEGILLDLNIVGLQLSQLYEANLAPQQREALKEERGRIIESMRHLPSVLDAVITDPQLDTDPPKRDNWVYKQADRCKAGNGAIVVGSVNNQPSGEEGELKVEEVRWILGKFYDYDDAEFLNAILHMVDSGITKPVIIQATDHLRMEKALRLIRMLTTDGRFKGKVPIIVQTYQEENPHFGEIQRLMQGSINPDGLYVVPRLHPTLQPMVDVIFFFKFAVALARCAGLTDVEIDSSRNLAKSVTVKGVSVPGIIYSMFKYANAIGAEYDGIEVLVDRYRDQIDEYWRTLRDINPGDTVEVDRETRAKAIARLPLICDTVFRSIFSGAGHAYGAPSEGKSNFKKELIPGGAGQVKKIVVITEETPARVAAQMAQGPLGRREAINTGKDIYKVAEGKEETEVTDRPINGEYYTIIYNNRLNVFKIKRQGKHPAEIVISGEPKQSDAETVSHFFGKQYLVYANKTQGLVFTAVKPDLCGVSVKIHRPDDQDLIADIDDHTIVVALRRSGNRRELNAEMAPIGSLTEGRAPEQLAQLRGAGVSEDEMMTALDQISAAQPKALIYSIADRGCARTLERGRQNLGCIELPEDLDDTSFTPAAYLSLLGLGTYLGYLSDDMGYYKRGLAEVTSLMHRVVTNTDQIEKLRQRLVELRQNTKNEQYSTVQIIGGAQDEHSASLCAYLYEMALERRNNGKNRRLGQSERQLIDSGVHGPLAVPSDDLFKFINIEEKLGTNPKSDPNPTDADKLKEKDGLVVILGTDSRVLQGALVDLARNRTRSARVIFVVKESDMKNPETRQAIEQIGAELVVTLPDSPNELTCFSNAAFANIFVDAFLRSLDDAFKYTPPVEPPTEVPATLSDVARQITAALLLPAGVTCQVDPVSRSPQVFIVPGFSDNPGHVGIALVMPDEGDGIIAAATGVVSSEGMGIDSVGRPVRLPSGHYVLRISVQTESLADAQKTALAAKLLQALTIPANYIPIPGGRPLTLANVHSKEDRVVGDTVTTLGMAFHWAEVAGAAQPPEAFTTPEAYAAHIEGMRSMVNYWVRGIFIDSLSTLLHWGAGVHARSGSTPSWGIYAFLDGTSRLVAGATGATAYQIRGPAARGLGPIARNTLTNIIVTNLGKTSYKDLTPEQKALFHPERGLATADALRATFDFLLASHNRPASGEKYLSNVRVWVYPNERESERRALLEELREKYGLQIAEMPQGASTEPYLLNAMRQPQTGEPIDVVMAVAASTPAFGALALTNSVPGSVVNFTLISKNVNLHANQLPQTQGPAAPQSIVGFGGAYQFEEEEERAGIRHQYENGELIKEATPLADILSGKFVFSADIVAGITEPTNAAMVAHTDMDPRLFGGVKILGPRLPEENGAQLKLDTIHVNNGSFYVVTETVDTAATPPGFTDDMKFSAVIAREGEEALEAAQEDMREKIQKLTERGVSIEGDQSSIIIGDDVDLDRIEPGARIRPGAQLFGPDTAIKPGAIVQVGTYVNCRFGENSVSKGGNLLQGMEIQANATVIGSLGLGGTIEVDAHVENSDLRTQGKFESHTLDKDGMLTIRAGKLRVKKGARIVNFAAVTNSDVGAGALIDGGSIIASQIGQKANIANTKAKLLRLGACGAIIPASGKGEGRKPSATEHQERWAGLGFSETASKAYGEGMADTVVATPGGTYFLAFAEPIAGDANIWSSFTATGQWPVGATVKTVADVGVSKSSHNSFLTDPLAMISHNVNIVGQPYNPSPREFPAVMTTDLRLGVAVGPKRPQTNIWGPVVGSKVGTSWSDEDPTFLFFSHPQLLYDRITSIVEANRRYRDQIKAEIEFRKLGDIKFDPDTGELDNLGDDIIRAKIAQLRFLIEHARDTMEEVAGNQVFKEKGLGINPTVIGTFEGAIKTLEAQLAQGLWAMKNGELVSWRRADGKTELRDPGKFYSPAKHILLVENPERWLSYDQLFNPDYTDPDPVGIDPTVITEEMLQRIRAAGPKGRRMSHFMNRPGLIIDPSAVIEDEHDIEAGTPDNPTIIGAYTTVPKGMKVGAGARLFHVKGAAGMEVGAMSDLSYVYTFCAGGKRIVIGAGSKITVAVLNTEYADPYTKDAVSRNVNIGKGCVVDHGRLLASSIGDGATVFPYCTMERSTAKANCKLGAHIIYDCNLGTGVTAQHLATALFGVDAPDAEDGSANTANIAAAAIVGKPNEKRVVLHWGTFVGTHAQVPPGLVTGPVNYILGVVKPQDAQRPWRAFTEYQPTKGGIVVGGVLQALNPNLGIRFIDRFVIGYGVRYAETPAQNEAAYKRAESELVKFCGESIEQIEGLQLGGDLVPACRAAVDFVRNDLQGNAPAALNERIQTREGLFDAANKILKAVAEQNGDVEVIRLVLSAALSEIGDARYRIRDGNFEDATQVNISPDPNFPIITIIPNTDAQPGKVPAPEETEAAAAAAI